MSSPILQPPTRFRYREKSICGYLNCISPQRGVIVRVLPEVEKLLFFASCNYPQSLGKPEPFSALVYDFKFPDLSIIAYNHWLKSKGRCGAGWSPARRRARTRPDAARRSSRSCHPPAELSPDYPSAVAPCGFRRIPSLWSQPARKSGVRRCIQRAWPRSHASRTGLISVTPNPLFVVKCVKAHSLEWAT